MERKKLVDESIGYMLCHLDEALSLDAVAAHGYLSKYHFSRIFKEETGESVCAFLKRCRMDQSAVELKLEPARSVTDVGLAYGYSASNYSSAFKQRHQVSPMAFKRALPTREMPVPFDPQRTAHFKTAEEYAARTELQQLDDLFVIYERLLGSYADLAESWGCFLEKYQAFLDEKTVLAERFFHDPAITRPPQCICDLCMTADPACGLENVVRIAGGKGVVYHFNGGIQDIFEALQGFFSVWLPQSGYRMARPYGLDLYRSIDWDTHSVGMDLWVPVE